jgi:hypothetical protein
LYPRIEVLALPLALAEHFVAASEINRLPIDLAPPADGGGGDYRESKKLNHPQKPAVEHRIRRRLYHDNLFLGLESGPPSQSELHSPDDAVLDTPPATTRGKVAREAP